MNLKDGFRVCKWSGIYIILFTFITFKVSAQTSYPGPMKQLLFPDFYMSQVLMKNGTSQSILLNYNTVSEKMVYWKDEHLYDVLNTDLMDTVYIAKSKFVPVGKVFYEVLSEGAVPLFVQHAGSVIPPGTPAGYGGTSQVSNTKYISSVDLSTGYYNLELPSDFEVKYDPVYWIRIDDKMLSFINERQFLKLFPEREDELKKFIKLNRIKFDRFASVIRLVETLAD